MKTKVFSSSINIKAFIEFMVANPDTVAQVLFQKTLWQLDIQDWSKGMIRVSQLNQSTIPDACATNADPPIIIGTAHIPFGFSDILALIIQRYPNYILTSKFAHDSP